ncbi:MAG: methionyl-tRNA formyltransferase [Bacillota bacterium]|nr:methionyl-tRNA formyltransferase [Bacillota bacterium]
MRIIYLGSPEFAVLPLRDLVAAGHQIAAVYTQPDRPRGRGGATRPTAVKAAALELGLPVFTAHKINQPEHVAQMRALEPQVIVVVAFGSILRDDILRLAPHGCINIHASLLPKYRGAAPIQWAVINGERESGVTTMHLDAGMDTGDMILSEALPIGENETAGELHDRLQPLGSRLLLRTLELLESGQAPSIRQDHAAATYAPPLTEDDELLDWRQPAQRVHDRIRGLSPFPGAYTLHRGKRLKIYGSRLDEGQGRPGQVIAADKRGVRVACGSGAVQLTLLQPPGKAKMDATAYVNGYRLAAGEILGVEEE